MKELFGLLKEGNKSALTAALVNTIVSIIKGVTYFFTGNIAMFAETLHSLGDAANQFFVFIGSALSKKRPTKRFPHGFGRIVNLVLLGAVIVVGIMAFETIREGFAHIIHPTSSTGFLINLIVLLLCTTLEFSVLVKAMREIAHDVGLESKGLALFKDSILNLSKAQSCDKTGIFGRFGCNWRWTISDDCCDYFTLYTLSSSRRYCLDVNWYNDVYRGWKSLLGQCCWSYW